MLSGVYWNQPVCPSVCPCVRLCTKYYFLSKRWRGYHVTFSDSSSFSWLYTGLPIYWFEWTFLPHNHDFYDLEKGAFWNHCEKRRKIMLVTSIFSFPTMFSTIPKRASTFVSHLFCRLQMLSIRTSLKFCCLVKYSIWNILFVLIVWYLTPFQQYFSYIAATSTPIHAFLESF